MLNNKSARREYAKKKAEITANRILKSSEISSTKIRPIRQISKTSKVAESTSRNSLFLKQRQHFLNTRQTKPLTGRQIEKVKEAIEDIKVFENAPFILAYAFALGSLILSLYSQLTSLLASSVELMTNLIKIVPYIGWIVAEILDAGVQAIGFALALFISLIQFCLSLYIMYFRWKNTTFLKRFLVKRFTWAFIPLLSLIPLANLIPWSVLSVYILQKQLKKRANRGRKLLKKYNIET